MDALLIRPARPGDADAVFDLLEEFAQSYTPARAAFAQHYPQLLRSEHAALLVAQGSARVVGYALAFDLLTLYANGIVSEIQELVVHPDFRGRKIGRRLVEAVLERGRRRRAIEITVPTRRAGDFYRELGFEETAAYFKKKL